LFSPQYPLSKAYAKLNSSLQRAEISDMTGVPFHLSRHWVRALFFVLFLLTLNQHPDSILAQSGDVDSSSVIRRFQGHSDWVQSVAFSPDGQTVLSGSADATLILWDVTTGEALFDTGDTQQY
jgi:WD40 repeat protein